MSTAIGVKKPPNEVVLIVVLSGFNSRNEGIRPYQVQERGTIIMAGLTLFCMVKYGENACAVFHYEVRVDGQLATL